MEKIIIMGGGGHAKVLIDLIRAAHSYEIIGIIDKKIPKGKKVCGIPVLGDDTELESVLKKGISNICIGVGTVTNNDIRKKLYTEARNKGFSIPSLIHPQTIIAADTHLEDGTQIMAGAIIQTHTRIAENSIINTGARIDHDCAIGSHVHIAPGTILSGTITVGDGAFIGTGAVVIQSISIGEKALIGAGAVVVHDVAKNTRVRGVPAKEYN